MAGRNNIRKSRKRRLTADGPVLSPFVEEHVRRERRKARELRQTEWWKRKRSRGICYYCGKRVPPRELTMEHIVPLARGGRTEKNNVAPACKECNTRKQHKLPMEWPDHENFLA